MNTLKISEHESIATLTIDRPDKLNALNGEVLRELRESLKHFSVRKDIKGLLLEGNGEKAFIAGADIGEMKKLSETAVQDFCQLGQEVSLLLENIPFPVIACVHGFALGGGCEMALSCDFIYATSISTFGQPEISLGLIPGFGGTQRLPRWVGMPKAKELIFTGRQLKAKEAKEIGLVQRLFSDKNEMKLEAHKFLLNFSNKSSLILTKCKEVMNRGSSLSIEEGLKVEERGFTWTFKTYDGQEGMGAFLEKRSPNFQGK